MVQDIKGWKMSTPNLKVVKTKLTLVVQNLRT